ncbi:hypothetical protein MXD59_20375 [Frankia sp. Ag45/Mut15]|uniref:Uncharacterized protein n=1 Tax=Frankia umida TaxID=573489 RepID=A0ABT0K2U2_9ACTN|nr:hypothetical protein [Frankia umida]MCK9878098.1 hypothetical protein [Frankia umida]
MVLIVVNPGVLSAHLGLLLSTATRLGSAAVRITAAAARTAARADQNLAAHRARADAAAQARRLAEQVVRRAETGLTSATQAVEAARTALTQAQARTTRDEDGTLQPADTWAEQAALARAEAEIATARRALVRAQEELRWAVAALAEAERRLLFARSVHGRAGEQVAAASAVTGAITRFQEPATDASFLISVLIDVLDQYLGEAVFTRASAAASALNAAFDVDVGGAGDLLDIGDIGAVSRNLLDLSAGFGLGTATLAGSWTDEVGRRFHDRFAEPLVEHLRAIAHHATDVSTSIHGIEHDLSRDDPPESWEHD